MPKISRLQLFLTLIVIIAIAWLVISHKTVPPPAQTTTTTPVATTPTDTSWPSQEVEKKTISDSNQNYRINVNYPQTKDPHIASILKSFADDQVAQFKEDTSWATDPATAGSAEATSLSLDVSYTETKSAHADTYVFDIVTYTGGAHGLQVSRTFAFDQAGKSIAIKDLFTNGQDGLQMISTYVQAELGKKGISDAKWIADGAGPTPDNYQNFIITDEGVTFIFDPYQVAAYAAGGQDISVPLSVFKRIANPALFSK